MPESCCGPDYDTVFDARRARSQAQAYRRDGPTGTTRRLIEAIRRFGVEGRTVLDIGGGVEVIGLELLGSGAASVFGVEAARAYVAVARHEITRRGLADRAIVRHGDFVEMAAEVEPADIVTLDRVVCCYGDWQALVDASVARARRLYGLVIPNDRWWTRAGIRLANLLLRLSGRSFRAYVHPERLIDARIRAAGFERRTHHRGWLWQTDLYARAKGTAA
jgi:2-polyprenyl-3-methyl-5-hydroxy-6-metoxy-1,4-benzoquinol methylase